MKLNISFQSQAKSDKKASTEITKLLQNAFEDMFTGIVFLWDIFIAGKAGQ